MILWNLYLVIFLVVECNGFKYFQAKIPNGEQVPHPCKPNYIWGGVGHRNSEGGGTRNPFGEDFEANGKRWDRTLCLKDSDGDGRTNGEELGDPSCQWTEGGTPQQSTNLTHPGICEPTDSEQCRGKNQWEFCTDIDFKCDGITRPDVRQMTLQIADTAVPGQETTYICQAFQMPTDQDYHIVGWVPKLDNRYVMHHQLLYSCSDPQAAEMMLTKFRTPKLCGMGGTACSIIGGWTLGDKGTCNPPEYGQALGKNSVSVMMLQLHWNNPEKRTDYRDHSGLTIYYTPQLRPNNAALLVVGQNYLNIPPGLNSHMETGLCRPVCADRAQLGSVFLTRVYLHMHYLGKSAKLEILRKDGSVELVAEDEVYSYDSPVNHVLPTTLKFNRGDSLRIQCEFQSTKQTEKTFYGDATADEMCYAFITYYPGNPNYKVCTSFNNLQVCSGVPIAENNKCNPRTSLAPSELDAMTKNATKYCDPTGQVCKDSCIRFMDRLRTNNDCARGDLLYMTEFVLQKYSQEKGRTFRQAVHSCDGQGDASVALPGMAVFLITFLTGLLIH